MPRPTRSMSGTPTSRDNDATAAETADSVTTSRPAAERIDPESATSMSARHRDSVILRTPLRALFPDNTSAND